MNSKMIIRIQILFIVNLLMKRNFLGEHRNRMQYSAVKNITDASSIIFKILTIVGYSVDPSSNDGNDCKTNVSVESSTTDRETNPAI